MLSELLPLAALALAIVASIVIASRSAGDAQRLLGGLERARSSGSDDCSTVGGPDKRARGGVAGTCPLGPGRGTWIVRAYSRRAID
jgi:hypothetical protein